ncbi:hypothetical protein LJC72_02095, partial [Bacteroides sp. OttesenSCG-928-D19]|nr:hypothetical protein [Bacteroides sp. OttesenSCG-928-D19]
SANRLTELSLSGLPALMNLQCQGNQLTELSLSGLTKLSRLNCHNNPISQLDVSANAALTTLWCGNQGSALTVWVDPATILGQGGGKLWVQAIYTVGSNTSFQDVTQRDTPVDGVIVRDKP